jgi:hypothetical protein
MKSLLPATLAIVSLIGSAFALTEAHLAPAALTGKTLTFTVETGAAPFATSGSFTGTFGAAPGNAFTKTRLTGDATNTNGTWSFNSSFSGMYEYTIVHFVAGRPDGILTLWISGGAGRYEVFLDGLFGNSQTGGFTIGTAVTTAPEITVKQPKTTELADGKSTIKFGAVKSGKSGPAKTFTIKNTGTATLSGLALTKSGAHKGDFVVTALGATSLAPGKSTTFKVSFKPSATGTRNAVVKIASNDADESPFDIKLTGKGSAN